MLSLRSIHASYGPIKAIRGIDIEVQKGEVVCLIGSNGAGKTTTLMTISGIMQPDAGNIVFEGREINNIPPHRIVEKGICQVPEGRRIFPRLTVMENLEMGAFILGQAGGSVKKQMEKVFELFPVLRDRRGQTGGTLSGGEQQMLAVGRALMSNPKLLLLDEPSLGLAPQVVKEILQLLVRLRNEGM